MLTLQILISQTLQVALLDLEYSMAKSFKAALAESPLVRFVAFPLDLPFPFSTGITTAFARLPEICKILQILYAKALCFIANGEIYQELAINTVKKKTQNIEEK